MSDDQYTLFGGIPPHEKASATSREAALSVMADSKTMRASVLAAIKQHGNLTCDEVEVMLDLRHQTASARIRELVLTGFIRDSGTKRPTRSNRNAVVYEVAQ